ncbi:MAG: T9SS type A sorting domain-containing protein [FCB group bacterium]|nr:T9SS type A sorting domain-containing protein [FCB group bacterium]
MRTFIIPLLTLLASVALAQYPNNMTEIDAFGNEFYFGIDSFTYLEGSRFAYELTVQNNSNDPIVWSFNSAQTYDQWLVSQETGDTLWVWSAGKGFAGVMITLTIEPGESFSINDEAEFGFFSYTVPAGDYLLHGNWVPYSWMPAPLIVTLPVQIQSSGIPNRENILAKEFELHCSYPNPFNASTSIAFELPKAGFITLSIFDITGREVKSLVNGHLALGRHEVVWDASGMGSGVYFARMEAGDFVQTRKLLLMK